MLLMRFVDLFCGIGGFHAALHRLGHECVFATDIDEHAAKVYEDNWGQPQGSTVHCDIREIIDEIPEMDIICAGFPCQPFSLAGVSKYNSLGWKHGFNHEVKGTLFFDVVRIIEHHKPKAFLLENVKNLKSHDKGRTWKIIEKTLVELGYNVHSKVINSSLVVPQRRERVFIVGFREETDFEFPDIKPTNRKLKHILDSSVPEKYTLTDHLWNYLLPYNQRRA